MTSSAKFAVPFSITLKTSFILNSALLFMYLGSCYWVWVFDLNLFIKLILTSVLTVSGLIHIRQYLFKSSKRSVIKLVWQDLNRWQLNTATGEVINAELLGSSFVNPWLIILNFKPEQGGWMLPVVVMPDSVDTTTFRRLSVKLRLYGGAIAVDYG